MTTLDQLRQRLEDVYLEPAEEETPTVPLSVGINSTDTSVVLTPNVLSPDEESYIGPNRLLEVNAELVRVLSYNANTKTATVRRGARGTTAVAHSAGTDIRIPTRWTRAIQYQALRTAINALWQPLYGVREEWATADSARWVSLPLNTVRILEVVTQASSGRWRQVANTFFSVHPQDDAVAGLQLEEDLGRSQLVNIRYGVRAVAPDDVTAEIEDLPTSFERIVLVDAAAELLSGVDVDAVSQEILTESLRLDGFPVISGSRIQQSLIRYREYLIEKANAELKAAHPRRIKHRKASW